MIVASRRAASTRMRSHLGSSSAARSAIAALAFSISASDGSKRATSCTTMQTLFASL